MLTEPTLPFGLFFILVMIVIVIVGSLISRTLRPREDPYATRISTTPSSLGVPVDPDEQAAAAAAAIRIKAGRNKQFAESLRKDRRAALLAEGLPESMLDNVIRKLGEIENDLDRNTERRFGQLMGDWEDRNLRGN